MEWSGQGYGAGHTVLVLPLEQFILNAFEKAPSRGQDERWTEKDRERGGSKGEKQ